MNDMKLSKKLFQLKYELAELREFLAEHLSLYKNKAGWTSLHGASFDNSCESVSLLLDNKADINALTIHGDSSLSLALYNASNETSDLLLEREESGRAHQEFV
jgi:ankyrin repeat protein